MLMLCIRAKGPEQAEGELSARWFCTFPPQLPLCQQMGSRGWGVGLSTILQGILCTTSPAALGLQSLGTTPAALGGHPTPETVLVFPLCFEGRKDLIVWVWPVKGQTCRLLRNWVLLPAVCTQQGQIQTPTCSDLFLAGWMFLQSVSLQLLSQGPHRYSWIRVSYLLYLPVPQR